MPAETTATGDPTTLACVPGAIDVAERAAHFALAEHLIGSAPRVDVPGGYAFTLVSDAFDDVAQFVRNERRCCPFLTFSLEIAPFDGPLTLRITGTDGARALLDAVMRLR